MAQKGIEPMHEMQFFLAKRPILKHYEDDIDKKYG